MKYRGKYRNLETATSQDKIRNLTIEEIQLASNNCEFLGQILVNLGLKNKSQARLLLVNRMTELNIDFSKFKEKSPSCRLIDLTGKKFGYLTVIARAPTTKAGNTMWLCREDGTGIEKPVASTHLLRGNTKSFSKKPKGEQHHQWEGHGKISGGFWTEIKTKAIKRKLEFSITIEHAWDLFQKQDSKCALSGEPIYLPESWKCPRTASLDRIDSTKGYIEGNVQWLHKDVNIMKNKFSQERFLKLCQLITEKNK